MFNDISKRRPGCSGTYFTPWKLIRRSISRKVSTLRPGNRSFASAELRSTCPGLGPTSSTLTQTLARAWLAVQ
eukprot:356470-Pyramimonas_sp.AAC.2